MKRKRLNVLEPLYWRGRLIHAKSLGQIHRAIFEIVPDGFHEIGEKHKTILATHIGDNESVLDAGCGYGHLLDLMPTSWRGDYLGIDISPDLIEEARGFYEGREFVVGDLRSLQISRSFDWGIIVSIRSMIVRNVNQATWKQMERSLRGVCRKLLYLEYHVTDPGSVE